MALSAQRESRGIDLLTCLGNAVKEVAETFLPDALFGGQVSITMSRCTNDRRKTPARTIVGLVAGWEGLF